MDGFLKRIIGSCLALCATAGIGWGQDKAPTDEVQTLRELIQQQQKQIDQLSQRLNSAISVPQPILAQPGEAIPAPKTIIGEAIPAPVADTKSVESIIADYLKANPGAGMPNGVQTGYSLGTGFYIKSVPNPDFSNWSDESAIPWEMRFRGRIQANYDFYKVQDNYNHLTKQFYNNPNSIQSPASAAFPPFVANRVPGGAAIGPPNLQNVLGYQFGDFSALEAKRVRLIWEGNVLTPNLTYELQLDANTRGFGSFQNNKVFTNTGVPPGGAGGFGAPGINGQAASPIGGQIQTDQGARLFTAWLAYQIPFGSRSSGSVAVPDGAYSYTPSLTFIFGKQQPYFSLIEILGSATSQFADFNMANWFFDTDANNMLMAFSAQYKDFDDRLMVMGQLANGSDGLGTPAVLTQRTPEFIGCFWWDFGGEFNQDRKRWDLFGNSISDLNYSRNLTVRVGGDVALVHLDPRNQYGDVPSAFFFAASGAPGGTRLINLFAANGATAAGAALAGSNQFDMNTANINTYSAFLAAHYRGFSFYNEWYWRTYGGMHSLNNSGIILYNDTLTPLNTAAAQTSNAVLNRSSFMDVGCAVQAGYFIIPKKLEVIGEWSMVNGQSGDIYGNGTFKNVQLPGVAGAAGIVRSWNNAFTNYHMAQEFGGGFNYYWFGQLVKWTTDCLYYRGGNPAGNEQAPGGDIPGVNGWLFRTQIQIAF
jgi:hypothetical protein